MTTFDIIAGLILVVSAFIGFVRGATRELVTVVSFLLAAVVAVFALRLTGPLARKAVDPDWAGLAAAVLIVFVLVYIVARLIGGRLTEQVQAAETFGPLDRAVGVGFGLIRALVLLGAFNLVFNAVTPAERAPAWVQGSLLYPLTSAAAAGLKAFAPKGEALAGKIGPAIEKAVREEPRQPQPGAEGYDDSQRQSVDDLVEKSR